MKQDNSATLTKGEKSITTDDFFIESRFFDVRDDNISFYMIFHCNEDTIFGTHVNTDQNNDYLDVFSILDLKTCSVQDTLHIILQKHDACDYLAYRLNDHEKEIIRTKMYEELLSSDGAIYHCPHCGHAHAIQIIRTEATTWQSICDACGHSFAATLDNDSNLLRNSIDYCHGQQIVCTNSYQHFYYRCANSALNSVSSCMSCPRQGCHIHATAQDVELLLNGEDTITEIQRLKGVCTNVF